MTPWIAAVQSDPRCEIRAATVLGVSYKTAGMGTSVGRQWLPKIDVIDSEQSLDTVVSG